MQNSLAITLDILIVVHLNTQGEKGISGGFDMKGGEFYLGLLQEGSQEDGT